MVCALIDAGSTQQFALLTRQALDCHDRNTSSGNRWSKGPRPRSVNGCIYCKMLWRSRAQLARPEKWKAREAFARSQALQAGRVTVRRARATRQQGSRHRRAQHAARGQTAIPCGVVVHRQRAGAGRQHRPVACCCAASCRARSTSSDWAVSFFGYGTKMHQSAGALHSLPRKAVGCAKAATTLVLPTCAQACWIPLLRARLCSRLPPHQSCKCVRKHASGMLHERNCIHQVDDGAGWTPRCCCTGLASSCWAPRTTSTARTACCPAQQHTTRRWVRAGAHLQSP